jgi:two-component system, LytTR family, response regulator
MKNVSVVLIDDEPLARQHVRRMLEELPDFVLAGEAANGREALMRIHEVSPDLLLLDIHMPELDGFDVLRALPAQELPFVVFLTAHDDYALEAFKAHALDYLLKPIEPARFEASMLRVRDLIRGVSGGDERRRLERLLADLAPSRPPAERRLMVKRGQRVLFYRPEEIDWFEAAGNYVRLRKGSESFLMRETMNALAATLPSRQFVRVQRSVIINIDRLLELRHEGKDDYVIVLRGGAEFNLSPRYRSALEELLGRF